MRIMREIDVRAKLLLLWALAASACSSAEAKGVALTSARAAPLLPAAFRASIMPLGDSHTSGLVAQGAQPANVMESYGCDGTGAWRRPFIHLAMDAGVPIANWAWLRGSVTSTDPNIPLAHRNHQGLAGYQLSDMESHFATWWALNPTTSIILMGGTNDWAVHLRTNPGDYAGAASTAAAHLAALLATIKRVAGADVVVGFVTPPTGFVHKAEALLSVPLFKQVIDAAAAGGQKVWLMADLTTAMAPELELVNRHFTGYMAGDDVHLNELGNRYAAGLMFRGMLDCPWPD